MYPSIVDRFSLTGRVAVITGAAGLLGERHARALASAGATPVLVDIRREAAVALADAIGHEWNLPACGMDADITNEDSVAALTESIIARFGKVDILVNNAANNPKMESGDGMEFSRLENFPLSLWEADLAVGLRGAFLCARAFGSDMARRGQGVIVNIASDLGLIAPDQRIYRRAGTAEDRQPVKPVTYSVVKTGLIGLTRYLATYWADRGVRVNALSPGGVFNGQPADFVERLTNLIPMKRMATRDEYEGALLFLCSDASSYMTGANLVVDGGRTTW